MPVTCVQTSLLYSMVSNRAFIVAHHFEYLLVAFTHPVKAHETFTKQAIVYIYPCTTQLLKIFSALQTWLASTVRLWGPVQKFWARWYSLTYCPYFTNVVKSAWRMPTFIAGQTQSATLNVLTIPFTNDYGRILLFKQWYISPMFWILAVHILRYMIGTCAQTPIQMKLWLQPSRLYASYSSSALHRMYDYSSSVLYRNVWLFLLCVVMYNYSSSVLYRNEWLCCREWRLWSSVYKLIQW